MSETEEGMDFESVFADRFKNRDRTNERLKAERVAGLTQKQRQMRKPPKQQINFRATAETKALIEALGEHLGKSVTDVIALAVEELAKLKLGAKK
jgi:hypothetical protein